MIRWPGKRAMIVLGVVPVLMLLLASWVIANPFMDSVRDTLMRTATRFVSRSLNGSLEVGALRGSLFSAPVLHDVVLRDQQGEVVAQIAEIRLDYTLTSLFKKRLDIKSIEIVQPQLTLVQGPDGQVNLGQVLAPMLTPSETSEPGGGLPVEVVVDSLQIRDGQATVRLPAMPGVQQVEGLQARLQVRIKQEGLSLEVQQVTGRVLPADVELHTLEAAFQTLGGATQINQLRLHMGATQLTASGTLPGGAQTADFALHMQPLSLTDIGRLLQNDALHGTLPVHIQFQGPPEALQVHSQLQTDQGQIQLQGQLNMTSMPLHYNAMLDVSQFDLATLVQREALQSDLNLRLHVNGAGLSVPEFRGEVQLTTQPSHLGSLALQPSQLHIAVAQQRIQVHRLDLNTSAAQMTASGVLDLAGDSDLHYELTATLTELESLLGIDALAGTVQLHGEASGTWPALRVHGVLDADQVRYQAQRLKALHVTYEGTDFGTEPHITAQAVAQQAQIASLPVDRITLDAAYQGDTRALHFSTMVVQSGDTGGQARGRLTFNDTEQRLVLETLQVRLPERTWEAVNPLQVAFGPQRLLFQEVYLAHAKESIELSGAMEGMQLQDIRLQVNQIDLSYLQQLLQLPDVVGGRATGQAHLAGTLEEPQFQAELTIQPEPGQHLPFAQLRTSLAYDQQRLRGAVQLHQEQRPVLTLDMHLPVHLALTDLPSAQQLLEAPLEARLHLQQPDLAALQRWQPTLPSLPGTVQGTIMAQGTSTALTLATEGPLQVSGFDLPRTEVRLGARWTPQRLELTRLQLHAPGSELQGQGYLTLPAQQIQFQLMIARLQLDTLPISFPPTLPPVVQGTLTVSGSLPAPQLEANLRYAGGQIQTRLAAQLQDPVPRYQGMVRLEGLELAQVLPAARGQLQGRIQLQGQGFSGQARQATLDLNAEATGLGLAPDVTTHLQASLDGETLRIHQLQGRSAPLELTVSGTLSDTRQLGLQYTLTVKDLAALQPYLDLALRGSGGLTGEVQGPLHALQTRGTLRLNDWQVADLRGQRLLATVAASQLPTAPQISLKAQLLDVQGPALPSTSVRLEGNYATEQGTFTVAVTEGPLKQTRLAGNVSLAAGQRLTLNTLRLQYQDLLWQNAAPVEVRRSPQGVLQVQPLLLRSNGQEIRGQGTFDPAGAVQATIQARRLPIRPYVHAVAPEVDVPDGRLSLELTLRGTLQQPQLDGNLQLTTLQWQQHDLGELLATVSLRGTTVRTDLRWRQQGRVLLQAQGTVGTSSAAPLDMRLQTGGIDLDLLARLSPAVVASAGKLGLDLHLRGTLQQPQAYGNLTLQDGVVGLAATGERYKDIQIQLRCAGDRITIEQWHIGSRSGSLRATGQMILNGLTLQQVQIAVRAQNFTAMHTPGIEAALSAAVDVQGSLQALSATGAVTVTRARVRLQEIPGSAPKKVQSWELTVAGVYGPGPPAVATVQGSQPAEVTSAPLPFLRADLKVDIPRNTWLQGPGTAVELSGDLRLAKEYNAPLILSGSIVTVRGFASYFGKKFTVERGEVTFTGSPEINPLLDVTVTKQVSEYLLKIQVTDRAQQPKIILSSTPELSEIDIVSLLLVGKTSDRLTGAEQNSLSSQTQQIAGTFVAGQLEKTVGVALGLDTIDVTAGDQWGTGSVKIGRYVTQDIFLSYERELGERNGNTVGAEYSLSRRLKLKASSSDLGETAVDVLWRLDY